jgi:hypothetical protein
MTLHGDGSSAPGEGSVKVRLIDLFWAPTICFPKIHLVLSPLETVTASSLTEQTMNNLVWFPI